MTLCNKVSTKLSSDIFDFIGNDQRSPAIALRNEVLQTRAINSA